MSKFMRRNNNIVNGAVIKPCPECGYPNCYPREPAKGLFDVFCAHCRFSGDAQATPEEAVMEWNKLPQKEAQNA